MFGLITALIILLVFILYKIWAYHNHWKYIMKIPGPKGLPLIGISKKSFTCQEFFKESRLRAKQFYPIYKLWSFGTYFVALMTPEDIELVLSNSVHNKKSKVYSFLHDWLGTGLLTSNGSKWQRRRKILTPAFHFSILKSFVDVFNKETDSLIEVLNKTCGQSIDVVKPITEYTLCSIGETSLGVDLRNTNSFSYKQAARICSEIIPLRVINPLLCMDFVYNKTQNYKTFKKYCNILHEYSIKIIEERRKQIKNTNFSFSDKKRLALLDLMLEAGLDDEDIREEVDTFMFEGHDTTAVALFHTLVALANEQHYQDEIYEEILLVLGNSTTHPTYQNLNDMKFMEKCIKECLRLYPSVPFISRVTGQTIKTHTGYTIPKGSVTNIYIYDLHHSEEVWEDPEKFNPERFSPDNIAKRHPFAYLPFSAGGRNCIGKRFAMLELKAAICGILRKFKLQPVDKMQDLKFKSDLVLRPVGEIKVKFVAR